MVVFRKNTVAFLFKKIFVLHQYLLQNEQLLEEKSFLGPELVVNVEENYLKLKWGPGITCGNIVGGEVMKLQQNVDPKQQLFSKI